MNKHAILAGLAACALSLPVHAAGGLKLALPSLKSSSTPAAAGLPGLQIETSLSRPGSGAGTGRTTISQGLPGLATLTVTDENFGAGKGASDAVRVNLGSIPPSLGIQPDITLLNGGYLLNPNVGLILPGVGSPRPLQTKTLVNNSLLILSVGDQNNGMGKVMTVSVDTFLLKL